MITRPLFAAASLAVLLTATASAQLSFSDQTAAAGITGAHQAGPYFLDEYAGPGATGDFDGDGYPDLFLPSGGGTAGRDFLYMNQGDGTFQNKTVAWGLTLIHRGLGVAVGDTNADGYLDIYETSNGISGSPVAGFNKLYRNVNGQSFVNDAAAAGVTGVSKDSFGATFGDYDLDGWLDLFVPGLFDHKSRLYRNQGDGTFADVTTASQLASPLAPVFAFASQFADMDGDRYPELLVVGDFGTSRYFRNNGDGTFTDVTGPSGTGQDENGMGGAVGDLDRDGRFDWYVTSIYLPGQGWTGNKIYQNIGPHQYQTFGPSAGVADGGYGWGTVLVDFDHDRWLDIAEVNGDYTFSQFNNRPAYLRMNQGGLTFVDQAIATGFVDAGQGRGLIQLDYDRDGDADLLVVHNNEPFTLWRNDLAGPDRHWLRVHLDTSGDPGLAPNGYGSTVRVTAGGVTQTGHVFGGDNLQSQSELSAHFGLGAETVVNELRVEWSDGAVTTLLDVPVDQHITVSSQPIWSDVGGGVGGSAGAVTLSADGMPGAKTSVAIAGAAANASGLLFLGVVELSAPLFGGTFVPAPQIAIPIAVDGSGALAFSTVWPPGTPPGTSLWLQAWLTDPGATFGVSASNGLAAFTP